MNEPDVENEKPYAFVLIDGEVLPLPPGMNLQEFLQRGYQHEKDSSLQP